MEGLYYDPRIQKQVEVIELLNDWGFRIVDIESTLYSVSEFIVPGEEGSEVVELSGQNITKWVIDQTRTQGLTDQAKNAMISQISQMPIRRRKFSRDVKWKEYLSATAYNV